MSKMGEAFAKFAESRGVKLTNKQKEAVKRMLANLPEGACQGKTTILRLLCDFDSIGGTDELRYR